MLDFFSTTFLYRTGVQAKMKKKKRFLCQKCSFGIVLKLRYQTSFEKIQTILSPNLNSMDANVSVFSGVCVTI